jgi:AAA ATPase containing von Willebrand factor type A (vWA) domain
MADDPHNTSTSDVSELVPDNTEPSAANVKEDAETTAARRELKQTTISDKAKRDSAQLSQEDDKSASEEDDNKSDAGEPEKKKPRTSRGLTPEVQLAAPKQEVPKETVASPKKRTHDELEQDGKEEEEKKEGEKPSSQNRAERDEPEKKRPRDRQASLSVERDGQKEVVGRSHICFLSM